MAEGETSVIVKIEEEMEDLIVDVMTDEEPIYVKAENESTETIKEENTQTIQDHGRPMAIVKRFLAVGSTIDCELPYYQLVNILKQLRQCTNQQRTEYLLQFIEEPEWFNARTMDLVNAFCAIEWHLVSREVRIKYIRFLCDIATFNPFHINNVLRCIAQNCLNVFEVSDNSNDLNICISQEEREEMFQAGLEAMYSLVPTNSIRLPMLVSLLRNKIKIHKSASVNKFISYIRFMLTLADKYQDESKQFWFCIVDCLLKFDGELSNEMSMQRLDDVRHIFPKHEDNFVDVNEALHETREKMDACMAMILCYISLGSENPAIKPSDYEFTKWMQGWTRSEDLFSSLLLSLDSQVFFLHDIENVPFIWFYMCSEDRKVLKKLLKHSWQIVTTPSNVPNDWKRAHNTATFMAGLLARAEFVDIKLAFHWLKQMIEWAVNYATKVGQVKFGGGIQHGIFYATVQAAFFLLCFRYKEFNEGEMIEEIRLWGIARIVHSRLEPLNFIPKPLALFFASISRYMQLVYCNHIINMGSDQHTVEAGFPFLRFGLLECGKYFQPHLRVFVPVENDFATVNSVRSRHNTEVIEDDTDYGFVDEDDGIELDYDYSSIMEH